MATEDLGRELSDFLRGLFGSAGPGGHPPPPAPPVLRSAAAPGSGLTLAATGPAVSSAAGDLFKSSPGPSDETPRASDIRLVTNRGVSLKSGDLVLTDEQTNSVYRVDATTGDYEKVAHFFNTQMFLWRAIPGPAGNLYCTLSGTRRPDDPYSVFFGRGGAVVSVDIAREKMTIVPGTQDLLDPCDLSVTPDGRLLITDFRGFGGAGAVYLVDPRAGTKQQVALGGYLREPIGAVLQGNEVLIANAMFRYEYPEQPDGRVEKDNGSLVRVDLGTGHQEEVIAPPDPPHGSLVGVVTINANQIAVIRCDWPMLETNALIRVEKGSWTQTEVVAATPNKRRFFSAHSEVMNGLLYTFDSYEKELLAIDVPAGRIVSTLAMPNILGAARGVFNSFEVVDCVAVVR